AVEIIRNVPMSVAETNTPSELGGILITQFGLICFLILLEEVAVHQERGVRTSACRMKWRPGHSPSRRSAGNRRCRCWSEHGCWINQIVAEERTGICVELAGIVPVKVMERINEAQFFGNVPRNTKIRIGCDAPVVNGPAHRIVLNRILEAIIRLVISINIRVSC